jgi:hypothetical protein
VSDRKANYRFAPAKDLDEEWESWHAATRRLLAAGVIASVLVAQLAEHLHEVEDAKEAEE